jgi:hypothetical protein
MSYPGNPHEGVTGPLPDKRSGSNLTINGVVPTALAIGTNSTCASPLAFCNATAVRFDPDTEALCCDPVHTPHTQH